MALSDRDQHYVDSWFTPSTRATEVVWIEKLKEIVPLYTEHGFTVGEGAILFLLSQLLTQVTCVNDVLARWDKEKEV